MERDSTWHKMQIHSKILLRLHMACIYQHSVKRESDLEEAQSRKLDHVGDSKCGKMGKMEAPALCRDSVLHFGSSLDTGLRLRYLHHGVSN